MPFDFVTAESSPLPVTAFSLRVEVGKLLDGLPPPLDRLDAFFATVRARGPTIDSKRDSLALVLSMISILSSGVDSGR